jgi:4-amino-4-deoxy-L-arabinose transferase-like glycosyltransferase
MQWLEKPSQAYLLLGLASLAFFALSCVAGHPVNLHEGILVQGAREMWASGNWWIPRSGGRPWIECPPLPFWVVAVFAALGGYDHTWILRLAPALAATTGVLATSWIGTKLYNLRTGVIAGALLATTFEFARLGWMVDDEIFLTTLTTLTMAAFVASSFQTTPGERLGFFGGRSGAVWLFFLFLGTSNLVKGFFFGNLQTLLPISILAIWQRDIDSYRRYRWFWGFLLYAVLTFTWPVSVQLAEPGSLAVWNYHLAGRLNGGYFAVLEGPLYYLPALLRALVPWVCLVPLSLVSAWKTTTSRERFLICWAVAPVLVLSLIPGKHHHYLLPCIPAWVLLIARWLARLGQAYQRVFAGALLGVIALFTTAYFASPDSDLRKDDISFLHSITDAGGIPLLVNADLEPLDNFRILYELGNRGKLIQNLSFLLADSLPSRIWIITRADDELPLRWFGTVKMLAQSQRKHPARYAGRKLTLFEVALDPSLRRVPADGIKISPMQTLLHQPGPFLTSGLNYNLWKQ